MNTREHRQTKNSSNHSSRKRKIRQEQMRRRRIRLLLTGLFIGFFACLLIFSLWKLGSIFLGYHSSDKEYEELEQYVLDSPIVPGIGSEGSDASEESPMIPESRIDLNALQEINSDAIGWIEIPDTSINYPLVHTTDDTYYLNYTFNKEKNKAGSIFVEAANHSDFSDLHTIIYGHNMKNGSMFAGLKNFQKQSYQEAHPYIYIDLADGSHCYEIFSCHVASTDDITSTIGYAADEKYESFLETIKSSSLYDTGVEVGIDDLVITLYTCTNNGKDRFVVHARKVY